MYFLDNNTSVSIETGVRQSVSGSVSLSSAGLGGRTPSCQGNQRLSEQGTSCLGGDDGPVNACCQQWTLECPSKHHLLAY